MLEALSPLSELPFEKDFVLEPATSDLPGISIVMPVFNAAEFIEGTIRSLLLNDLSGCELIMMDGGSKDGTMEVVEHYRAHFDIIVSEPDRGQSDAINKGMARATRPILCWLNGDDIFLPNSLNAVRRAFRDQPSIDVVVGDAFLTERDFTPIHHFRFSEEKLAFEHMLDYARNHLIQPSVFFSRAAWEACGPVKQDLHYAMDADLFLAMARMYRFKHIPIDVAYSVYHDRCKTRDKRAESLTELAMVQARHGGFVEARATLDRLVTLFNDLTKEAGEAGYGSSDAELLGRRLRALERETEKNRQLLLDPRRAMVA